MYYYDVSTLEHCIQPFSDTVVTVVILHELTAHNNEYFRLCLYFAPQYCYLLVLHDIDTGTAEKNRLHLSGEYFTIAALSRLSYLDDVAVNRTVVYYCRVPQSNMARID